MKKSKVIIAAAAALAVAGGGAALAADRMHSPAEDGRAVIDDAAKQLGVQPNELSNVLRRALENRIDEAVDEGRLTDEQADALKKRLRTADVPLLFGFGVHGPELRHLALPGLDAAAAYLGVGEAELRAKLEQGKSLADIATAAGKSVDGLVAALTKRASERLDQAVEDGRLTNGEAAEIRASLEERIRAFVEGGLAVPPWRGMHRGRRSEMHPRLDGFGESFGRRPFEEHHA